MNNTAFVFNLVKAILQFRHKRILMLLMMVIFSNTVMVREVAAQTNDVEVIVSTQNNLIDDADNFLTVPAINVDSIMDYMILEDIENLSSVMGEICHSTVCEDDGNDEEDGDGDNKVPPPIQLVVI